MRKSSREVERFSKFLSYVLGRRPDEFGLVPDNDGFVRIKELLQALHEEPGWRHIRPAHLNEVVSTLKQPPAEIVDTLIRALERSKLPAIAPLQAPAKLLYIATRRRAYPVVIEKGMAAPPHRRYLVLSDEVEMAMRMGRRADNQPVLLTVQIAAALEKGAHFRQYGQHLFLADQIIPGTFSGPPLAQAKPESVSLSEPMKAPRPKTPGSYFPEPEAFQAHRQRQAPDGRHREPDWKKARRQARKHKEHQHKQ